MLGISVYLSEDIDQQVTYVETMRDNGFTSIFTSLHIPEDDQVDYKNQLKMLGQLARRLKMELMADISPKSLSVLGFNWENAEGLLQWGLTGVRVDYGVEEQTIIDLSHKMKIALNASTLSFVSLKRMKENGLVVEAVEAWHNFYPRPETGLDLNHFIEQNKQFTKEGLTVMAFIPGDKSLRGPLFMGLPTLEKHRNNTPFTAFLEMNESYVDKILVGDPRISDKTLAQFNDNQKGVILLRAIANENSNCCIIDSVARIHTNRADYARDCIRSVESRQYAAIGKGDIEPENCVTRPIGSITIDNVNYLRYQGEVQVTVNELPLDEKVNVIGRVIKEDIPLLKHIKGDQMFKIDWIL